MWQTWRAEKPDKASSRKEISSRPSALIDIDGVLSDASHRQHYLDGEAKDWHNFFAECVDDQPIGIMAEMIGWLDPEIIIVALTARPHWVQNQTREWLNAQNIRWDLLVMREEAEDKMLAKDFKVFATKELMSAGFNFLFGLEDDPANVEVLRGIGVPCAYVHSGYYSAKPPQPELP